MQKLRIQESNTDLANQINSAERTIRISIQVALIVILIVIFLTFRTRGLLSEIRVHKKQKEVIQYQANHDELTQIPNRAYFHECLLQAISNKDRQQHFTLLFIDLDGFKAINDNVGHDAGDFILQETARRLSSLIRKTDMAARLGGDEFILFLDSLDNPKTAETIADKICKSLCTTFLFQDRDLQISCSIGIVMVDPSELKQRRIDNDSLAQLIIKHADEAMYQAKKGGKNQYCVYTGSFFPGMAETRPVN